MHPRIRLTLITPPQGLGCREYILERRGRYVLGRSRDCDIMLPAEGVSRHHCVLALDPPTLRVRDLGSRNGTYLNGESIGKRSCPEPLAGNEQDVFENHDVNEGDVLRIGSFIFRVEVFDPSKVHEALHSW